MKCDAVRSFWYIATLLFLYFLIRILNFHINKKIEKLSLNFRYNEISNIASKILKTNYEKLQAEIEDRQANGGLSNRTYEFCELKEYTVAATNYSAPTGGEDPLAGGSSENTPWG